MSEEIPPSQQVGANDQPDNGEREIIDQLRYELIMLQRDVMDLREQLAQQAQSSMGSATIPRTPTDPADYLGEKAATQDPWSFGSGGFPSATQNPDTKPAPYEKPGYDEILDRLGKVERRQRSERQYPSVFWAKVTGNVASNGTAPLKEQYNDSTGIVNFPDGRWGNATSNVTEVNGKGGVANGTNVLVLEYENSNTTQYSYLSLGQTNTAKILSVASGSTPGPWVYNGQTPGGSNITLKNTLEPCNGSPGSLGVNVASNGTVNGGPCVVQSLGPTSNFLPYYTDSNGTNWITVPNSAQ